MLTPENIWIIGITQNPSIREYYTTTYMHYYNDVKPLSRLEKESKYSSKLLPIGDLPKPRNSYNFDSAAGMKKIISGYE